jgi:hypothetical protein
MLMRVDHYNFLYTAHQNLERENIKDRSPIFLFEIYDMFTWYLTMNSQS